MLLHCVRTSNVSKGIAGSNDLRSDDGSITFPQASSTRQWSRDGRMVGNLRVVSDHNNRCDTLLSSSTCKTTITLHSLDMKRLCRVGGESGVSVRD